MDHFTIGCFYYEIIVFLESIKKFDYNENQKRKEINDHKYMM